MIQYVKLNLFKTNNFNFIVVNYSLISKDSTMRKCDFEVIHNAKGTNKIAVFHKIH